MKKSIFTLMCIALTLQFSSAQIHYHYSSIAPSDSIYNSIDTILINSSLDTAFQACGVPGVLTGNLVTAGYANGTNTRKDLEKMEKYVIPAKSEITHIAMLSYTANADGGEDTIHGVLRNRAGEIIARTHNVPLSSIVNQSVVSTNLICTIFNFEGAVPLFNSDTISVGVTMPTVLGDTLAISSTPDGCSAGGLAWEQTSDGSLHTMKADWNVDIDFLIFPVYDFNPSITSAGITLNGLTMKGAYPNPAENNVNINYAIDKSTSVSIELYDVQGRLAKTAILGNQNPGTYTQNIDLSSLAKGTYFYSIITKSSRLFGQVAVQ